AGVALPRPSVIRAGDWLVAPGPDILQQLLDLGPAQIEVVTRLEISDSLPLRSAAFYYRTPAPLQHLNGPRVWVLLARARTEFIAPTRAQDQTPASAGRAP